MKYFFFYLWLIRFSYADFWFIDTDEHSHVIESKENLLFLSLGTPSLPASLLRYSDLRKVAFPFDWCLSFIFIRSCYKDESIDLHRYFKYKEIIDISDNDSIRLHAALRTCFPRLKMKLLILNEENFSTEGIVIEKII